MVEQKTNARKVLRLRQLRRQREMTLADVAAKVGLAPATIGAFEQGHTKPSFDSAKALATLFGVPMEELFEYVEVPA